MAAEAGIATGKSPAGPAGNDGNRLWRLPSAQLRRILGAAMFGAAVFLVQAGVAELVLRSDRICQETRAANWAFNPQGCQPEGVRTVLQGLSRGPVGALRPDLPAAGVLSMAAMMAVAAALLGFLPLRQSVPAFLILEAVAAIVFGFLGFLLLYLG